jgi:peptidoglycan/xylan/chitin deacetylase (PgdA/CDA1 family)
MPKYRDMGGSGMTRRILLVSAGTVSLATFYGAWLDRPKNDAVSKGGVSGVRAEAAASATPEGTRGVRARPAGATARPTAAGRPAAKRSPGGGKEEPGKEEPGKEGAEAPEYYVHDGQKVIALTIDDGPSPVYTPQVLAILARYKVRAAFSMIGQNVSYYPGVAREVAAAGHMIVNHTWDHANLARLSAVSTRTEIDRAAAAIHAATGTVPRMFRAPYGTWTTAALDYCGTQGLTPLDWSVDPRDWARPGVDAIVNTIMTSTRTGSIILEHDGGGDRSQTVAALRTVVPRLLDEGYRFTAP